MGLNDVPPYPNKSKPGWLSATADMGIHDLPAPQHNKSTLVLPPLPAPQPARDWDMANRAIRIPARTHLNRNWRNPSNEEHNHPGVVDGVSVVGRPASRCSPTQVSRRQPWTKQNPPTNDTSSGGENWTPTSYDSDDFQSRSPNLRFSQTHSVPSAVGTTQRDVSVVQDKIYWCVITLYSDRIRPTTTDVINRHKLHHLETLSRETVLQVATDCEKLDVRRQTDGATVILLRRPPDDFPGWVDPHNPTNPYPPKIWAALHSFLTDRLRAPRTNLERTDATIESITSFQTQSPGSSHSDYFITPSQPSLSTPLAFRSKLTGSQPLTSPQPSSGRSSFRQSDPGTSLQPYQFKGGRYGLASEMMEQVATFKQCGFTLGEACHLVQLAINKGILLYEQSVLQPIAACEDVVEGFFGNGATGRGSRAFRGSYRDVGSEENVPFPRATKGRQTENLLYSRNGGTAEHILDVPPLQEQQTLQEDFGIHVENLLYNQTEGVILAQLKKHLFDRYKFDFSPERLGVRKLVDAVLRLSSVCRVYVPPDRSHRLVVAHRRFPMPAGATEYTSNTLKLGSEIEGCESFVNPFEKVSAMSACAYSTPDSSGHASWNSPREEMFGMRPTNVSADGDDVDFDELFVDVEYVTGVRSSKYPEGYSPGYPQRVPDERKGNEKDTKEIKTLAWRTPEVQNERRMLGPQTHLAGAQDLRKSMRRPSGQSTAPSEGGDLYPLEDGTR